LDVYRRYDQAPDWLRIKIDKKTCVCSLKIKL
jgi:hypothetical protein